MTFFPNADDAAIVLDTVVVRPVFKAAYSGALWLFTMVLQFLVSCTDYTAGLNLRLRLGTCVGPLCFKGVIAVAVGHGSMFLIPWLQTVLKHFREALQLMSLTVQGRGDSLAFVLLQRIVIKKVSSF